MVCQNCEKKLAKLATPETWKQGSSSNNQPQTENKLLSKNKYGSFSQYQARCRGCGDRVTQRDAQYCQRCAYKQGVCSICGVKLHDLRLHRQNEV